MPALRHANAHAHERGKRTPVDSAALAASSHTAGDQGVFDGGFNWEHSYQIRTQREIECERAAVAEIEAIAIQSAAAFARLWNWGDGDGDGLLEIIAKAAGITRPVCEQGPSASSKASIPAELRRLVYERDAYRCVTCGTHIDLTLDHRIPESKGGPTTFENLQTMCRPCNCRKGVKEA